MDKKQKIEYNEEDFIVFFARAILNDEIRQKNKEFNKKSGLE